MRKIFGLDNVRRPPGSLLSADCHCVCDVVGMYPVEGVVQPIKTAHVQRFAGSVHSRRRRRGPRSHRPKLNAVQPKLAPLDEIVLHPRVVIYRVDPPKCDLVAIADGHVIEALLLRSNRTDHKAAGRNIGSEQESRSRAEPRAQQRATTQGPLAAGRRFAAGHERFTEVPLLRSTSWPRGEGRSL